MGKTKDGEKEIGQGKKKKKQKTRTTDRRKLIRQYPFLYFLAYNDNLRQARDVLTLDTTKEQYTLLRELAVNELANNLPAYHTPKRKKELKDKNLVRLKQLAKGILKYHNLGPLYPLIRIICQDTIIHHGIEGQKAGHRAGRRMAEDSG